MLPPLRGLGVVRVSRTHASVFYSVYRFPTPDFRQGRDFPRRLNFVASTSKFIIQHSSFNIRSLFPEASGGGISALNDHE